MSPPYLVADRQENLHFSLFAEADIFEPGRRLVYHVFGNLGFALHGATGFAPAVSR